ncbi:DUF3168 domain-containing protein [Psychrobacter namhaensis]|uniref:DUF3168 domain-containing protein n=1 Tax=Psychrobacter namhaensis TaxID=292734 RepID=UPI0018DF4B27|nr:DUF3168 domain-containing protein [Psychrobacter namhaensis]
MLANQTIHRLLGSLVDKRIYPMIAPKNTTTPYIVWQVVSAQPQNTLDGTTHHQWLRVQIDIYDTSYDKTVSLSNEVTQALSNGIDLSIHSGSQQLYENDTKLFRQSIDYEFWQTTTPTL